MTATTSASTPGFSWGSLANSLLTTAGSLVEKNIESKVATGAPPVNANPASAYSQPSGLIPGVSNQTLMIGAGALVGLVVLVAIFRK